jgi:hypothetical protein
MGAPSQSGKDILMGRRGVLREKNFVMGKRGVP